MATSTKIPDLENLTKTEALELYDGLETIDTDFMIGRWKGDEVPTGHPMDGLLAVSGWYGKVFESMNDVHPLVFYRGSKSLFAINPRFMPMGMAALFPRTKLLHTAMTISRLLIGTRTSKARLRLVEHRGKVSAAMIYDQLPIIDCFRKLDEQTVLGVMDFKKMPEPYFFFLKRDADDYKIGF